jgi:hypothetical protein
VLAQPHQQVHRRVLLLEQLLSQQVGQRQRAKRPDGVHEQRMGAVERVDEPAIGQRRPAAGLHGSAHFQRELVEVHFPRVRLDPILARKTPQISVGADVVEAVIVDACMRQVRRHPLDRARAPKLQALPVAGGVELQQRGSELKPLRPFGPPARLIPPRHREDRSAVGGLPGALERLDFRGRKLEQPVDGGKQIGGAALPIDAQHYR